ncbi:MAG: hypothetical protein WCH98_01440 [Verrucomicrobiota bacterium]
MISLSPQRPIRFLFLIACAIILSAGQTPAATLPQDYPYQVVLRSFLGALKESDFVIEQKPEEPKAASSEERRYLDWLPGRYQEILALKEPPSDFLLSSIEAEKQIMQPSGFGVARLAKADTEGKFSNPRALRLRDFVVSTIDLIMLDHLHESPEGAGARRSDNIGGSLIMMAYAYREAKPDLPPEVRKAYETGLRKMIARQFEWGPKNMHVNMELFAPVGLAYAAQALDDPEVLKAARAYTETIFHDERYYNPAGFFLEDGGFDSTYNGISRFFATWAGLLTDWDFIKKGLDQSFKLRAYLSLPEPPESRDREGGPLFFGPCHFNARTSGDSPADQWGYKDRNFGAAMLTDYALPLVEWPSEADLKRSEAARIKAEAGEPPRLQPWKENHWIRSNLTTEYTRKDFFQHVSKLREEKSPLLKYPFEKPERFVERFGDFFVVAKFDHFGVILFTGFVPPDYEDKARGFGGGNLSAFWTPESGPVILGRTRGFQGQTPDLPSDWRVRPVHAISGQTTNGKFFSSSRCLRPKSDIQTTPDGFAVTAQGIVGSNPSRIALRGEISYKRTFKGDNTGLEVESSVKIATPEEIGELCEIIPFFLRDNRYHQADKQTLPKFSIEFKTGSDWKEATVETTKNVEAIRVKRFAGTIEILLEKPQDARLSPEEWADDTQSRVVCRNVLIDFPRGKAPGQPFESSLKYRIIPVPTGDAAISRTKIDGRPPSIPDPS